MRWVKIGGGLAVSKVPEDRAKVYANASEGAFVDKGDFQCGRQCGIPLEIGQQLAAIEQAGAVFPRFEAALELGLTLVEVGHPIAAANGGHDGRADLVGVNQGWVFTVLGLQPDFP